MVWKLGGLLRNLQAKRWNVTGRSCVGEEHRWCSMVSSILRFFFWVYLRLRIDCHHVNETTVSRFGTYQVRGAQRKKKKKLWLVVFDGVTWPTFLDHLVFGKWSEMKGSKLRQIIWLTVLKSNFCWIVPEGKKGPIPGIHASGWRWIYNLPWATSSLDLFSRY